MMLTNWIAFFVLFLYSVGSVPSKDYLEGGNGDNESLQKFLLEKLKGVEKKLKVKIKNVKIKARKDCLHAIKTHLASDREKNLNLAAEVKQFEQLIHLVVRNKTRVLQSRIDELEAGSAKTMSALETMNSKLEKLLTGTESDTTDVHTIAPGSTIPTFSSVQATTPEIHGNTDIANTSTTAPGSAPRNVYAKPQSATTIVIEWDEPEIPNGIIQGYKVFYTTEPDLPIVLWNNQEVNNDSRMATVSNLVPYSTYTISVLAFSSMGQGPLSDPFQVLTRQAVPGEPKRVFVEAINSTAIYVTWKPPREKERYGVIQGYNVYYIELNDQNEPKQGTQKVEDTGDVKIDVMLIVGLKPDTRYQVSVIGYTRQGEGIRSRSKIVTTKAAVPSAPRHLVAEFIQEDPPQVQVSWNKPKFTQGEIQGYKIYVGPKYTLLQATPIMTTQQSYITQILEYGVTYEFSVLAKNEIDYGERAVTELKTPDGGREPPVPQNVLVTRNSPRTMQVTWDEPSQDNTIAKYKVYYCSYAVEDMNMWDSIVTDGSTTVTQITNLELHTSYAVRVQSNSINDRWSNLTDVEIQTDFIPQERSDVVQNFQGSARGSRQLTLSWEKPRKKGVSNYLIEYMGSKTYKWNAYGGTQTKSSPLRNMKVPEQQESTVIRYLTPKMKYEFNISAVFQDGVTGPDQHLIVETRIEAPQDVPKPLLFKIVSGRIFLQLQASSEINGPLSNYDLIVVPQGNATKRPQDFIIEELTEDKMPVNLPATKPYIAARFMPRRLPVTFALGTGSQEGNFYNRPLDSDKQYTAFLRAYTVNRDLYQSSGYSEMFKLTDD